VTLWTPPNRSRIPSVTVTPWMDEMAALSYMGNAVPSAAASNNNCIHFFPLYLPQPMVCSKAFWANGATVGTDNIDIGAYLCTDQTTGRMDLIRSTGAVLTAGASAVQEVGVWKVASNFALTSATDRCITTGLDSTDTTAYTTASVTLKAGRLYLMSVVNTAASAAAISSIAGGPTWTSRATTQYNTTAHRVSIWSCVPAADYTGTIVISYGATQTGARWALNEFSGVDTATTDGVVQVATGTGNSTTPLATLAAFGSANNATFGAMAWAATAAATPGAGFTELSDITTATTPASFLQTQWQVGNDTTVDATITSGQWGACAVEIKADASPFVLPATMQGNLYMAWMISGTTDTVLRTNVTAVTGRAAGMLEAVNGSTFKVLPSTVTAAALTATRGRPLAGFSSRSLIG